MKRLNTMAIVLGIFATLSTGLNNAYANPSNPANPATFAAWSFQPSSSNADENQEVAAAYQTIQWHESTSDAVLQDALPNTGRMFILYYKSGSLISEQQQRDIEDVARNWGDYLNNSVRFYKINVDADVTTISLVHRSPSMLMVVPDRAGKLIVLNCAVGARSHEETYDFFQKAMQNPANNAKLQSRSIKVTPDQVPALLQKNGTPVLALYYDSSSLLSAIEEIFFDQLSSLYFGDMTFVKIDLIQDEDDSKKLGGIPCLVFYHLAADGSIAQEQPLNGFRDLSEIETWLSK